MASTVGFGSGVAAVAPASSSVTPAGRRRNRVAMVAATRGGQAAAKEEKGLGDYIVGFIFKKDQLLETDPLLNKVDDAPSATVSGKAGGSVAGRKKPAGGDDDGGDGGGFNFGGLFAKKG